jgi:hypothetical protein
MVICDEDRSANKIDWSEHGAAWALVGGLLLLLALV